MVRTFTKGGVHPQENKLSSAEPIQIFPIPEVAVVLVSQHLGAPAIVKVKKGDKVKVGTLLAECSAFISAHTHSPVSGTVDKIDLVPDATGYKQNAIFIKTEGDEWEEDIDTDTSIKRDIILSKEQIVEKIKNAGIVGMGGATFPTQVKMAIPKGKTVDSLIINAVECEPYLTSDHRIMLEKAEQVMVGVTIMMRALEVNKAYIGIENNKPDAIELLRSLAPQFNGIEVVSLKVKYPQGGEKQLIKAILNREVPSGALPIDVHVVVQNVGTAYAVYEAVQKNKPLIERIVTVTGKSVPKPANFKVRIGTPIVKLIEAVGGLPQDTAKIVNGGPMMGRAMSSIDVPVTKGTSGILLIKKEEAKRGEQANCIRCGRCVSVCPMGLEPYLLMQLSLNSRWEEMKLQSNLDCIECGSCSYICPANRAILDYIRLGKSEIRKIKK
ncbi:MAG: electron transport complex subunit RsxC [Bacteroidales bacterium]